MNKKAITGIIGENIVANELLWRGWFAMNMNLGHRNTPNVDLIATKGPHSVHLQVKASTDKAIVQVGHGRRKSYFNGKDGPQAHFIVFVRVRDLKNYECYIVPAAVAEVEIARCYAAWDKTPKRNGERRKDFPASIYFALNRARPNESNYFEKWKSYLNAWGILDKAIF